MRLELIDGIRTVIIALLVYVPTVTISGWFKAWAARRCDDDLPERLGFLTLDPFAHFSFFGFAILLFGELFGNYFAFFKNIPGFGRFIHLDPQPINGKIKAILEFFAKSFAHFTMFTGSVIALFFLSPLTLSQGTSSFMITCKDLLLYFFNQNLSLCAIYFLIGLADSICFVVDIPRMFSLQYFVVMIGAFLVLGHPVQVMLSLYVYLLAGFLHV